MELNRQDIERIRQHHSNATAKAIYIEELNALCDMALAHLAARAAEEDSRVQPKAAALADAGGTVLHVPQCVADPCAALRAQHHTITELQRQIVELKASGKDAAQGWKKAYEGEKARGDKWWEEFKRVEAERGGLWLELSALRGKGKP